MSTAPRPAEAASQNGTQPAPLDLAAYHIAAVIPCYNEGAHIEAVLRNLPSYLRTVIVVDDASTDPSAAAVARVARDDSRILLVRHEKNQGVGGAMMSGYRQALAVGAQVVVKLDGDGQMDPQFLHALVAPLIAGEADYTKGNRFRDFPALRQMPALRRMGNMALSFLTKAAVGYWNLFDPCNGYVAIRGDVLAQVPLDSLGKSFFFETSMLAELYILGCVVRDVPMPARYGGELSHLSIGRVLREFPPRLVRCLARRLALKNFLYDFSLESVYLLGGLPLLVLGVLYGGLNWIRYAWQQRPAPTGTVVISAMLIILGFQLLLAAITEDVRSVPTLPLCNSPLPPQPARAAFK